VEANGSGVALLDYDNDGWLDIYLVDGSIFSALAGKNASPHAALFHNNHDGHYHAWPHIPVLVSQHRRHEANPSFEFREFDKSLSSIVMASRTQMAG
jgi:hypothetical protein